jgi:hypothetical protein
VFGDFSLGVFGLILRLIFWGNDDRLNPLARPRQLKPLLIVFQGEFMGNELVDLDLAALEIVKRTRKTVDCSHGKPDLCLVFSWSEDAWMH